MRCCYGNARTCRRLVEEWKYSLEKVVDAAVASDWTFRSNTVLYGTRLVCSR